MSLKKKKIKKWQTLPIIRFAKFYKVAPWLFFFDTMFALLLTGTSVSLPFITRALINAADVNRNLTLLIVIISSLILIGASRLVATFFTEYWGHLMGMHIEAKMRKMAVSKMYKLPQTYYDNNASGKLVSRIVYDIKEIAEFSHHAPEDAIIAIAIAIGGFSYAFLYSWTVGVVLIGIFMIGITLSLYRSKKLMMFRTKNRKTMSRMASVITNQASAISEIKAYNASEFEKERFNVKQKIYNEDMRKIFFYSGQFSVINLLIIIVISFGILITGSIEIYLGNMTVATFAGLLSLSGILSQPLVKFSAVYSMFTAGQASVKRFFEFMDLEHENISQKDFKIDEAKIEFKNVSFKYFVDGKEQNVLNNFNLVVNPKEKVALVGETGIGKSTILKLLMRYYEIQGGSILIGDKTISDKSIFKLRENITYIQQQGTLFFDSILANIKYAKPSATFEEIEQTTKEAFIHDFIVNSESGFETIVGPNGAKLSGGQKQKISMARAFLKKSKIILLDEATSSLDNITEAMIKKSIDKATKNKTAIIVAHRLSTIKDVDRIIVLGRGGTILEDGSHEQLIKNKGPYFNLLNDTNI
ncbi:MAG: ABC transporter ATP-binding protein/permease [Mycoplasma sp.]|nr:ABC transporter ATP-binding protein/permease [Mycoplasma sp.]